jgi:hypothetical protein
MGVRKIIVLLMVFGLIANPVFARRKQIKKEKRYPTGCMQMGYKFDLYNVVFNPSNKKYGQTIYFLHNTSHKPVYMFHANDKNHSYVVHVNGYIFPNMWSVLAVSEHKIKYICTNYSRRASNHRIINCKHVLRVCEFPYAKFGTNHRGTYWLVLNRGRKSAERAARYHGVLLVDNKQKRKD